MRKLILITPLLLSASVSSVWAQNAESEAALRTQILDNPSFAAAIAREEAAAADIDLARSLKRPQLRGDAEIGYLRETLTLPTAIEPGGPNSLTGEREPIRFGVGIEQLLFDSGVSTAAINVAKATQQAASFDTDALRQDLNLASQTAILNIRFNLGLVDERKLALDLAQARLDDVIARQDAGLATLTDVDQAKARRALAMAEQAEAKRSLQSVENDLRRLTGQSELASFLSRDADLIITATNFEGLIARALASNPTYLAALQRAESSDFSLEQAKGQDGPQVSLVAEAGYARDERFGLQLGEAEQIGAFVRGTWRFGTGGAKSARIDRSRALKRAATLDLDAIRRQLEDDIRTAQIEIEAAEASVAARELQLEAAITAQTGVSLEVETGRRTELDRLDADRTVANAKIERLRAETNLQIATLRLMRAIGAL